MTAANLPPAASNRLGQAKIQPISLVRAAVPVHHLPLVSRRCSARHGWDCGHGVAQHGDARWRGLVCFSATAAAAIFFFLVVEPDPWHDISLLVMGETWTALGVLLLRPGSDLAFDRPCRVAAVGGDNLSFRGA